MQRGAAALIAVGLLAGWAAAARYLVASRLAALHQWAEEGSEVVLSGSVVASTLDQREHRGAGTTRAVVTVRAIGRTVAVRGSAVLIGDPTTLGTPERGTPIVVAGRLLPLQVLAHPGAAVRVDSVRATHCCRGLPRAGSRGARRHVAWSGADRSGSDLAGGWTGYRRRFGAIAATAQFMRGSGLSDLTAVCGGTLAVVAGLVVGAIAAAGGGIRTRMCLAMAVAWATAPSSVRSRACCGQR